MSLLVDKIEKIVAGYESEKIFLIEVVIGGTPLVPKITVIVDSESGITIEQCTEVSRKLNKYLGEKVYTETNYTLEVTSPGADKPIRINRQYIKNIGRKFKFTLATGKDLEATLKAVGEDGVTVSYENIEKVDNKKVKTTVEEKLNYLEIKKANVIITI
jgi:ribosome maturation factor RimP